MTRLFRCPHRRLICRYRTVFETRPALSAPRQTAVDAQSAHDRLSRHHAASISERARFDISIGMGCAHLSLASGDMAWVSLDLPRPPLACPQRTVRSGHCGGRSYCCLMGNHTQPQRHRHHGNQFVAHKHVCDDVNANKSLYGNERETPSIRSTRFRRPAPWGRHRGVGR